MKSRRLLPVAIILFSLFTLSFAGLTSSQTTPSTFTVTLNSPADGATITSFDCNFTYTPTLIGDTSLSSAKLILNGTETSVNQVNPLNATSNKLAAVFTANGTYLWNIKIQDNLTNTAIATANFTLTVAVPPAPTPTPVPTATPAPTAAPTPTPAPTASPTPTPSPSPTPKPTDQPFTINIDGGTILIIALVVLAVVFALIILLLWKASR
jgi:hypothetical protein